MMCCSVNFFFIILHTDLIPTNQQFKCTLSNSSCTIKKYFLWLILGFVSFPTETHDIQFIEAFSHCILQKVYFDFEQQCQLALLCQLECLFPLPAWLWLLFPLYNPLFPKWMKNTHRSWYSPSSYSALYLVFFGKLVVQHLRFLSWLHHWLLAAVILSLSASNFRWETCWM